MLPDTCLQKCLVHAQAEEAVMETEMPADDTLHAKGTVSAQNMFYTMCFSELETSMLQRKPLET
jgi:hypothetical protein